MRAKSEGYCNLKGLKSEGHGRTVRLVGLLDCFDHRAHAGHDMSSHWSSK